MIIGRMDKRITLQDPVKTPDGKGGQIITWPTGIAVWSEFWKPKVVTADATGTMLSELTRNIVIRRRQDVKRGWRVLYGAKIFSVEHTYDYEKDATMLVCKEVVR